MKWQDFQNLDPVVDEPQNFEKASVENTTLSHEVVFVYEMSIPNGSHH